MPIQVKNVRGNMPLSSLDIKAFQGVVGAADPKDVPLGASVYAHNLNPINQLGLFRPLPLDNVENSTDSKASVILPFGDGQIAALVDTEDDTIKVLNLVNMTVSKSQAVTQTAACIASDGESVHVGLGAALNSPPKWVGTVFHKQFGVGPPVPYSVVNAEVERANCVGSFVTVTNVEGRITEYDTADQITSFDNTQVSLQVGYAYMYFASLIYDGHQEGPLHCFASINVSKGGLQIIGSGEATGEGGAVAVRNSNSNLKKYDGSTFASSPTLVGDWNDLTSDLLPAIGTALGGASQVTFPIRIRIATGTSKDILPIRVTGINIYRAPVVGQEITPGDFYSGDLAVPDPDHIRFIDINDTDWSAVTAGLASDLFNLSTDTYKEFILTDDLPGSLSTFGSRTGLPSTMEHMRLHYGLSVSAESYHIVGYCWHPELLDINSWLFRSKPYRYDVFDWTNDYLVLPSRPTALAYFSGRVYAFCKGRTYVISVGSFDIEDTWEGIGCNSQSGVVVTDRGMFWADDANLWWHDGSRSKPIGAPILSNEYEPNSGWHLRDVAHNPVVVYEARYDSVLFCFTDGAGLAKAWMFNVNRELFSLVTFAATAPFYGGFSHPDGYAYVNVGATTTARFYSMFTSGTKRAWKWVSPIISSFGFKVRYTKLRIGFTSNRPTVRVYDNDPTYTTAHELPASGGAWEAVTTHIDQVPIEIDDGTMLPYAREIAFELEGTANQDATQLTIIKRDVSER